MVFLKSAPHYSTAKATNGFQKFRYFPTRSVAQSTGPLRLVTLGTRSDWGCHNSLPVAWRPSVHCLCCICSTSTNHWVTSRDVFWDLRSSWLPMLKHIVKVFSKVSLVLHSWLRDNQLLKKICRPWFLVSPLSAVVIFNMWFELKAMPRSNI